MYACAHAARLKEGETGLLEECVSSFSPVIERVDSRTIVFDIQGLGLLYGETTDILRAVEKRLLALGVRANIAAAQTPDTAILAAQHFSGTTILSDKSAQALTRLKVNALPLTPEIEEALSLWGIRTFEEFLALPLAETVARLGSDIITPYAMARGERKRPLILKRFEEAFEERVEFEDSISLLEPLVFVLGACLTRLCEQLKSLGLSAIGFDLELELEDGSTHSRTLRFPVPFDQSRVLLKLIQLDLAAHPPSSAITALNLKLVPALPRRFQKGLLVPLSPEPDKLEVTLARVRALVGESNLGRPVLIDSHRPDACALLPFKIPERSRKRSRTPPAPAAAAPSPGVSIGFRYFRPPREASVQFWMDRPVTVRAEGLGRGRVISFAGPWRSSGDWWNERPWDRDEWDVLLQDGTLYRLCRDAEGGWFIEGAYD